MGEGVLVIILISYLQDSFPVQGTCYIDRLGMPFVSCVSSHTDHLLDTRTLYALHIGTHYVILYFRHTCINYMTMVAAGWPSPDTVIFPDILLTLRGTPSPTQHIGVPRRVSKMSWNFTGSSSASAHYKCQLYTVSQKKNVTLFTFKITSSNA